MAVCGGCGVMADDTLAWTLELTERGERHFCEVCSRVMIHDIESRLDIVWDTI